jgi:hypothetical protein
VNFQPLSPRQPITSEPYSIRSAAAGTADTATNALNLGGVAAGQFVVTTDSRLSDSRTPTAGSSNYIQNQSGGVQSGSFNITGNGVIGGNLLLQNSTLVPAGVSQEGANTLINFGMNSGREGPFDSTKPGYWLRADLRLGSEGMHFFRKAAIGGAETELVTIDSSGDLKTSGTFVGDGSGLSNLSASVLAAGTIPAARLGLVTVANGGTGQSSSGASGNFLRSNGTGWQSSALSASDIPAGNANYVQNTVSPQSSTNFNISGSGTAGGTLSGNVVNATTQYNINTLPVLRATSSSIFVGPSTGTTGTINSFFGSQAGQNSTGSANAFFGSQAGQNSSGGTNSFFGDSAGRSTTSGSNNSFFGEASGVANITGSNNTLVGANTNVNGGAASLTFATAIGSGATVASSNTIVLGRSNTADTVIIPGLLQTGLTGGGFVSVCYNNGLLASCSSSIRYKTNLRQFSRGLSFVNQLQPVMFNWKQGGMKDIGFVAENVAKLDPLFVTYNAKGEVEGVKYDRLSVAFVNAFKEQQAQIDRQQKEIDDLKSVVLRLHARRTVRKVSRNRPK